MELRKRKKRKHFANLGLGKNPKLTRAVCDDESYQVILADFSCSDIQPTEESLLEWISKPSSSIFVEFGGWVGLGINPTMVCARASRHWIRDKKLHAILEPFGPLQHKFKTVIEQTELVFAVKGRYDYKSAKERNYTDILGFRLLIQ